MALFWAYINRNSVSRFRSPLRSPIQFLAFVISFAGLLQCAYSFYFHFLFFRFNNFVLFYILEVFVCGNKSIFASFFFFFVNSSSSTQSSILASLLHLSFLITYSLFTWSLCCKALSIVPFYYWFTPSVKIAAIF